MTPENRDVGFPDRWASLFKQRAPTHHYRWRVSFAAGVLRVSSKLGSSHRTLTTPVEAYAPPCRASILPFWRNFTKLSARSDFASACQHLSPSARMWEHRPLSERGTSHPICFRLRCISLAAREKADSEGLKGPKRAERCLWQSQSAVLTSAICRSAFCKSL